MKKPFRPVNVFLNVLRKHFFGIVFDEEPCGKFHRPFPETLQEGHVVSIPRSEGEVTTETPLYIRQHLVDKMKEMNETFEDTALLHAYATGAPGCGKTCFFWMWAIMKLQEKKRLLFIQYRRDTPNVWILENDLLKRIEYPKLTPNNLLSVVGQLLNQQTKKFDFSILDGVNMNEDASKALMIELKRRTGVRQYKKIKKAVFVTSLHFKSARGNVYRDNDFNEAVDISFDSWTESDYNHAVQSKLVQSAVIRQRLLNDWEVLTSTNDTDAGDISDDDRVKEAVKLKYRYAGGCARLMFAYYFLRMKGELDGLMAELQPADWEEFKSNSVSRGATIAVHSLMQRFACNQTFCCAPVSEYVLRCAYQVCRGKLTAAVVNAADMTKNPSLLGWAFELLERDKIDDARDANRQLLATKWSAIQVDNVTSRAGRICCNSNCPYGNALSSPPSPRIKEIACCSVTMHQTM